MKSEFEIVKKYIQPLVGDNDKYAIGLSDDVGIVDNLIFSTDTIVEGIHFFSNNKPEDIAKKLVRVNVSDLIAKGVRPGFCLLNFSAGSIINERWIKSFMYSLNEDFKKYKINLVGGDTVQTKSKTVLSLCIFGKNPKSNIKLRSSAIPGDNIYVSGTIGDSALGLMILKNKLKVNKNFKNFLIDRYLIPQPRIELVSIINKRANASIDISDGLIQDLQNLCLSSDVGAEINFSDIPLSSAARSIVNKNSKMIEVILNGGDDYEILFTGPKGLQAKKNIRMIGKITKGSKISILDLKLKDKTIKNGFNHIFK